jgi:hypothetical protein
MKMDKKHIGKETFNDCIAKIEKILQKENYDALQKIKSIHKEIIKFYPVPLKSNRVYNLKTGENYNAREFFKEAEKESNI